MRIKPTLYSGLTTAGFLFCLSIQPARAVVTVTVLPGNQVAFVGSNVVFTAQASATAGETITGYTWKVSTNGSPYNIIAGATTATLTLTNVQTNSTGSYFAAVTYNSGTNTGLQSVSSAVTLTVEDQARITVEPQGGLIRMAGTSVSFSVSALGQAPLSYQWRLNQTNLVNNARITGANGTNLIISALVTADTGSYDVVVTNVYAAATSQVATLSVFLPPGISSQPQNAAVIVGSNAVFSVTATGSAPLSFQWQENGTNLANGGRISGATSNVLTIAATVTNDTGSYSVSITNFVGSVTSSNATLTVLVPATFTSATNATGRQGAFFSFTNTATGTTPIMFGAQGLPTGLSIDPNSGVISGIPAVMGVSNVAIFATNAAMTTTGQWVLTLTTGVPGITSALSGSGQQGQAFSYTITASNTDVGQPISFSASGLPNGLTFDSVGGVISGAPLVSGTFSIPIGVTNLYGGDGQMLTLTITSSVPVISSALSASGKQGTTFSYTIVASYSPTFFTASALPAGLNFNAATGVISGPPIVSGTFPITISAGNQFGADTEVLTLTITSSVPVITSALTATGTENQTNFSYKIKASNTPTLYGASDLPLGLTLNTTNGSITGTPLYGGTFIVPISAINAWGTGQTNLAINISYATLNGLAITDVQNVWSEPYLLDFSFSLQDLNGSAVVVPPSDLQVVCMENGVPIPSETAFILESGDKKLLRSYLVLDYTYSMYVVSNAIEAMQAAAELLINEEPAQALFGVCEFSADYVPPLIVTTNVVMTNSFISDKPTLIADIEGIQTNYVKDNYAGSRCWDAIYAAVSQFSPTTNFDENRYVIAMTDGNDDSSLLDTNADPVATIVALAQTYNVRVFCVAFGDNVNTNALQELTAGTGGQYYLAATTSDLGTQFDQIVKNIDGQYLLRWATLQRANQPFQPSFQVTYQGLTAAFNTTLLYQTNTTVDTNQTPPVTNTVVTNILVLPYNPTSPSVTGNVQVGSLQLIPDADVGPQIIRLWAHYVPRYVREIQINYRPNYPCTSALDSTGTNDILFGWTMTETTDTNGLRTLTMVSPNTNSLLSSIAYGAFGNLVEFDFTYPDLVTTNQAFSVFNIITNIYTNMLPSGQSFTLSNASGYITLYTNAPPHGTPIPWLIYYGFKTNFTAAELIATNGLPVWEDYLAGLNPTNANSRFTVSTSFKPGQTPQIIFSTVADRTYRIETATSLGNWSVLLDNIPGTGGNILFTDNRVLSGVSAVFYRVAVY